MRVGSRERLRGPKIKWTELCHWNKYRGREKFRVKMLVMNLLRGYQSAFYFVDVSSVLKQICRITSTLYKIIAIVECAILFSRP